MIAEDSYIGALLISPQEVLNATRAILRVADFQDSRARAVYKAACELADKGEVIDPVTIKGRVGQEVTDDYLVECMEVTVTAANAVEYARAVHEDAVGREIRTICAGSAVDKTTPPEELLRDTVAQLQALQTGSATAVQEPTEVARDFYLRLTDVSYRAFTSTGYDSLDTLLGGGLVTSGMIAIAARPGVGKTMLGLCIADNVAAAGIPVLYVSLEMDAYQLMCRRVGRIAGLSYNTLQQGRVTDGETKSKATEALSDLMRRPLYIEDKPASVLDVELKARGIRGLGLIVIDHLGLLRYDGRGSRYEIVTEISHSIKRLAQSLKIPIVALTQLNRENEGRTDKRPHLSDMRDSGAIEEDCDAVMLLHRPGVEGLKPWESQPMEIEIAKNRHGFTGRTEMLFYGLTARIVESGRNGQVPGI